ncbi:MAG: PHP domain-containing protein [Clostridia bacterium]|nr:PHP domain-containing protein [Clostridia bacterium]
MKFELIPESGRFYKTNLHCHTTISDGAQTPEEVKAHFKANGYSAVCYTDHEVLIGHKELCDDEFIALHGYEVSIKQDLSRHTALFMPVYHFNMIAESQDNLYMPRFFKNNPSFPGKAKEWAEKHAVYSEDDLIETTVYDKEWISEYLCAVRDAGFLITYNHPQWSLQNCNDYVGLRGLHAIEAMNGGCWVLNDTTSLHYEQMLRAGMDVVPVGGDDNHSVGGCCLAWTMIKAPELTYDALIAAYKKGDCYSSEGPEFLSLYIEDGEIVVKTSPAYTVTLLSEGRACGAKRAQDGTLTEARFPYRPETYGRYFRLEIRDAAGKRAYSRAYKPDEVVME